MNDKSEISHGIATELIKNRTLYENRMGIDDKSTNTNLISKNYSPMIIRKYNLSSLNCWPMWIGLIIDEDLTDLDFVVNGVVAACDEAKLICNNIQQLRNVTGIISETIKNYYDLIKKNCVEGIAIALYTDKTYIQNFTGDFMNHTSCRIEWGAALAMMPHI